MARLQSSFAIILETRRPRSISGAVLVRAFGARTGRAARQRVIAFVMMSTMTFVAVSTRYALRPMITRR